jgi:hypothetical protein
VELIQMGSRIPTSTGVPRSHGDQQQRRSPVGLPRWLSLPVSDLSPSPLAHLLALISWQPDLEHGRGSPDVSQVDVRSLSCGPDRWGPRMSDTSTSGGRTSEEPRPWSTGGATEGFWWIWAASKVHPRLPLHLHGVSELGNSGAAGICTSTSTSSRRH